MAETGGREQVARLLALVPYLHQRGEVSVDDAAAAMGVTPRQLVKDLKVLFVCGLPGGYPDDLIDVDLDALEGTGADGVIRVSNADYLARPVRFAPSEATAILVALRSLADEQPEAGEAVARTLAKLEAALGTVTHVHVEATAPALAPGVRESLERALAAQRRVRLTYYVPSRDEESERLVDPRSLLVVDDVAYLDCWCLTAVADRTFRLDRIRTVEVLEEPVGEQAREPSGGPGPWFAEGEATLATLHLDPAAAWVPEYYRVEAARQREDGSVEVDLYVASERWLRRLLLRLAPHARVLSPAAYAETFSASAQHARNLYDGPRRTLTDELKS